MDRVADRWGDLTGTRLQFLAEVAALDRERGSSTTVMPRRRRFLMHRCGMSARRARREVFLARWKLTGAATHPTFTRPDGTTLPNDPPQQPLPLPA